MASTILIHMCPQTPRGCHRSSFLELWLPGHGPLGVFAIQTHHVQRQVHHPSMAVTFRDPLPRQKACSSLPTSSPRPFNLSNLSLHLGVPALPHPLSPEQSLYFSHLCFFSAFFYAFFLQEAFQNSPDKVRDFLLFPE